MAKECLYLLHDLPYSCGVSRRVMPGRILPQPVIPLGKPGQWDSRRVQFSSVLYDSSEEKFRMWYLGLDEGPLYDYSAPGRGIPDALGRERICHLKRCYAESDDGLNWLKPRVGSVAFKGSTENNILELPPAMPGRPLVIEDAEDGRDAHRFKMIFSNGGGAGLALSTDGLHWQPYNGGRNLYKSGRERGEPAGFDFYTHEPYAFFRDDYTFAEGKRYRLYTQSSTGGPHWIRRTGTLTSPDAREWTIKPGPVMGIPEGGEGISGQVHGLAMMLYRGYYLAFIHFCLPHPQSGWLAPRVHLALSRDGERFHIFEDADQPLIPLGPEGSWWAGGVTADSLLQVGNQIRCYFSGLPRTACWAGGVRDADAEPQINTGLALWDAERLLCLELKEGFSEGYFCLLPFTTEKACPPQAIINADLPGGTSRLQAALADADTGSVLPGFSFADCNLVPWEEGYLKADWAAGCLPAGSRIRPSFRLTGRASKIFNVCLCGQGFRFEGGIYDAYANR